MSISPTLASNLASTSALVGLIWVVELAVYPLFSRVGADTFAHYHAGWTAGIGAVVGPLMIAEVLAALALAAERPAAGLALLAPVALAWLVTGLWAVPMHGRLAGGFDEAAWRSLLVANHVRTAAWTLRAAGLAVLVARG